MSVVLLPKAWAQMEVAAPANKVVATESAAVKTVAKYSPGSKMPSQADDLHDHLASVFSFQGEARILKKGQEAWKRIEAGMRIEVGDQMLTGKDSQIDIAFDGFYLNVTRIQENTKAEFRTIEPTDIHLEDGAIFSALDGLKSGDSYQIATPTAVAAVRGTHFIAEYLADTGKFSVATLEVPEDGKNSKVALFKEGDTQELFVPEGKQFELAEGKTFKPELANLVKPMDSENAALGKVILGQMEQRPDFAKLREQGLQLLSNNPPATEPVVEVDDKKPASQGPPNDGLNSSSTDGLVDSLLDSTPPPHGNNFETEVQPRHESPQVFSGDPMKNPAPPPPYDPGQQQQELQQTAGQTEQQPPPPDGSTSGTYPPPPPRPCPPDCH